MTKEHFWTLDTATLTCFRTLYPRLQHGHWRSSEPHLNNPPRRRTKKHRGKRAGIRNRLRKRAHRPPLPRILLTNVQFLENKMDNLRIRRSFQRDKRDCNIPFVWNMAHDLGPGHCCKASDKCSVLRIDRTAKACKTKGGGVCFMINKRWCDPRNITILLLSCSPHLEHLSIICRFYLPREFSSIIVTAVYIPPQADTGLALSKLHEVLSCSLTLPLSSRGTLTKPTSGRSCQNFINM